MSQTATLAPAAGASRAAVLTIGVDGDATAILRTTTRHKVRRLPGIDGHLSVGMVAQGAVAGTLPHPQISDLLQAPSTD